MVLESVDGRLGYNEKMARRTKSYRRMFVMPPLIAYGSYLLLISAALLKEHSRTGNINFMFLSLWGVLIFLVTLLLSLLGFVQRKNLRTFLKVANVSVSLTIIILSVFAIFVINKVDNTSYTCDDFVRCIVK
jgi:hypothetical protein